MKKGPALDELVLVVGFPPGRSGDRGRGDGLLLGYGVWEGAWWDGTGCCTDSVKAEMPMDKGGALICRTREDCLSLVRGRAGDKLAGF